MRAKLYMLATALALAVVPVDNRVLSQTMEISGYAVDSCVITYTIGNTLALDGWLDNDRRIVSNYSSGSVPIANISCTGQAVVGVKKNGGKLILAGASTCDYSGTSTGAATCARYTAVVDWASVSATSPASDDVPGSAHNSTIFANGVGVYTAHLLVAPEKDPANPMITAGTYSDTVVINVGNSI